MLIANFLKPKVTSLHVWRSFNQDVFGITETMNQLSEQLQFLLIYY